MASEETSRPESVPPPGERTFGGAIIAAPPPLPPPPDTGRRPAALPIALAAVLAVGAALAFGLPGGSSDGTPLTAIAEAAQRTSDLSGARFSGTGAGSGSGFEMQMTFEGAYNTKTGRSFMRMETATPGAPQVAAAMNPLVAIQDGVTMYMSSPAFSGALPSGKSWVKIDASEFGAEPISGQVDSVDAHTVLSQLASVSDDPRTVGEEKVRGVSTTHFTTTLDPGLQAEQLRKSGNELAAEVIEAQNQVATVDVWIDRRGLVRRTVMNTALQLTGEAGASMSMTMDFYDFGVAPDVDVPDEALTFGATALALQGLESAASN